MGVRGVNDDERLEALAELAHEQWSGWMKYMFSKCKWRDRGDGINEPTIPQEFADRWLRQMNGPYAQLSEQEKEYDRVEARKFLAMLEDA